MEILRFCDFVNEKKDDRPVVSFDLDGTLHLYKDGEGEFNFIDDSTWEPFDEVISILRKEAEDNKIYIVTARDEGTINQIWKFVKTHDLPIEDIHCTGGKSKLPILTKLNAVRHYDDNYTPEGNEDLLDAEIETIHVNPKSRTYGIANEMLKESAPSLHHIRLADSY